MGLWLGAMVLTGAAAAMAFPITRELAPELPAFAAYPKDHWSIAAGHVMNRVFGVCDTLGFVMACVGTLALLVSEAVIGWRTPGPLAVLRSVATVAALALVSYALFLLRPSMVADLDAFWAAARSGQIEQADTARAAFDAMHPRASMLLSTQAGLALLAVLLGVIDLRPLPRPVPMPKQAAA